MRLAHGAGTSFTTSLASRLEGAAIGHMARPRLELAPPSVGFAPAVWGYSGVCCMPRADVQRRRPPAAWHACRRAGQEPSHPTGVRSVLPAHQPARPISWSFASAGAPRGIDDGGFTDDWGSPGRPFHPPIAQFTSQTERRLLYTPPPSQGGDRVKPLQPAWISSLDPSSQVNSATGRGAFAGTGLGSPQAARCPLASRVSVGSTWVVRPFRTPLRPLATGISAAQRSPPWVPGSSCLPAWAAVLSCNSPAHGPHPVSDKNQNQLLLQYSAIPTQERRP